MKHKICTKMMVFAVSIFFMSMIVPSQSITNIVDEKTTFVSADIKEGQILYSPVYDTTTYLINETGVVNHTWHSIYTPLESYMVDNGSIIRSINYNKGGFQQISWNDTILWEYHYTRDSSYFSHDIIPLPNGDVIMIMQEVKTRTQAIQAGRNPNILGSDFRPDFLIQVNKTGPTSGDIVWEWHIWDHLIQDYDATKDNYGNVSQHPELININFGEGYYGGDWIHMNSVDYNPQFGQILMSAHNFDEAWIIDHNTTTEEAASHEGGQYGHGGDLLYRWGNPQAYDRGTAADEKLYFEHQITWIKPGLPGAGNILVFSNGNNRPNGPYSTADEFTPDVNNSTGEYYISPNGTYGPANLTWQYHIPYNLYSNIWSGVQRMINGNTLICSGTKGTFLEVTPDKQIVWTFVNPYPNYSNNGVYRTEYVPPYISPPPPVSKLECTGNLSWSNIKPGAMVHGRFQVQNVGDPGSLLNWTVNNTLAWGNWTFSPSSGEGLTPKEGQVTVDVYVVAPKEKNAEFKGFLQVQNKNNASDVDMVPVTLKTLASRFLSTANPLVIMFLRWLSSKLFS